MRAMAAADCLRWRLCRKKLEINRAALSGRTASCRAGGHRRDTTSSIAMTTLAALTKVGRTGSWNALHESVADNGAGDLFARCDEATLR